MAVICKLFFRSNQRKCSSWLRAVSQRKLAVNECAENGWQIIQPVLRKAVLCLMFLQSFSHFQRVSDWLLQKWSSSQSDPCSHCMLALVQLWNISPRPLQTFVQLEQCASYQGSRWIFSRRQHAPNKQYVLNNDVRLIT